MYENYFPNYDPAIVGVPIIAKGDQLNLYINYPGFGSGFEFYGQSLRAGYATGRTGTHNRRTTVQLLIEFSEYQYGFVYADEVIPGKLGSTKSLSDLEKLLNQIVTNNQNIIVNNLLCARLVTLIESKGGKVDENIKDGIRQLQYRVNERDQKLAKNEWLTGRKVGTPKGASAYSADLSRLMGANVGLVLTMSVTTIILISALVTAIIGTLLYYTFADSGKMSLNDFKQSQKFLDVLAKMSPEDRQIVEKEMSKALNYGYKIGGNTNLKNIGILAAGAGVFFLARPIGENLGIIDKK